jgi:hypothetical protein
VVFTKRECNEDHCWQYEIRKRNLEEDVASSKIDYEELKLLKATDFSFEYVPSFDQSQAKEIKEFIVRHEWLGKMPNRPTHRFVARYKGKLAGVVVMATPNAFSHLLGKGNLSKEKLISRGACISWSPPNLASWLIMKSVNWMIQNTEFRFFTAYADTEAKEIGTIYQACNFIYLGKKSGTKFEYFDDKNPRRGWMSDRIFRKVGQYKKYAKDALIQWGDDWSVGCKMHWDNIPKETQTILRLASRSHQDHCHKRKVPLKHKYVYIKGKTKKETKSLMKFFVERNPTLGGSTSNKRLGAPYPKIRGQ